MSNNKVLIAAAGVLACLIEEDENINQNRSRKRKIWVKTSLSKRSFHDVESKLIADLLLNNDGSFKNFTRISWDAFERLHHSIESKIKKQNTHMRESISTKMPDTQDAWQKIEEAFLQLLHFPNTIGAIDGKHIYIQNPPNSGSYFFNYKGRFSIVLLAMVDAKGNFLYVDVGCNGRISDGEKPLPGRVKPIPHVIIGDDAFALSRHVLRSFPKAKTTSKEKIFNFRLSHCRNVVERTFGRLVSRFKIFNQPIDLKLENIENIVLATCVLHNFLNSYDSPIGAINSCNENNSLSNISLQGSNRSSQFNLMSDLDHTSDFHQI
ncbi:putative nuclease HARBI1 [Condylostylus longicornis]|uniref:putative nuclease HARBI1 n=1 Tax=Condylostylus longicornis TaxID=2530218 RepID=UPI00244E3A43|nr:putative nuclease HARBI1 [Condylostylus longicornis]